MRRESLIGAVRALWLLYGSIALAFDMAGRERLERWYLAGPQCRPLEPRDFRRRLSREIDRLIGETR